MHIHIANIHNYFQDLVPMLASPMISDDDLRPWSNHIIKQLIKMGEKRRALDFIRSRRICVESYEGKK